MIFVASRSGDVIQAFIGLWLVPLQQLSSLFAVLIAHLLAWTTLITGSATIIGAVISYDMTYRRFDTPFFIVIFNLLMTVILLSLTGWELYRDLLPDRIVNWMANHSLASLTRLTWFSGISTVIQILPLSGAISNRYMRKPKLLYKQ